jgi:tRNA threonylcarbamoyladenosine biosynthesis protein TsaB
MRTLVIDTATRACSVALFNDELVVASHYEVIGRGHAERLLPFIADLPERGQADRIMVNVGPGSFTGIRVGVAAARALGFAWGVPVLGYGCLALVAAMARAQRKQDASVDVVMTGGHGEYFFQSFDKHGTALADAVSLPAAIVAGLTSADFTAGDIATPFGTHNSLELLPDAAFWQLIADAIPLPASPIYGRPADAQLPKTVAA